MVFKKLSPPFIGFLQASGLVTYIILIASFFMYIPKMFDNGNSSILAPIIMLLLFVISAVICSLMVLGRAGVLFWEKRYKEAFTLVVWTIGWGIFYFVLFLLTVFMFSY